MFIGRARFWAFAGLVACSFPGAMPCRCDEKATATPQANPTDAYDTVVLSLASIANEEDAPLPVRLNAIKSIGMIGTKSLYSVNRLKGLLSYAQDAPEFWGGHNDYARNAYAQQLVTALGQIGPPAREALPELVSTKGFDPVLIPSVELAMNAILTEKPATTPPSSGTLLTPALATLKTTADNLSNPTKTKPEAAVSDIVAAFSSHTDPVSQLVALQMAGAIVQSDANCGISQGSLTNLAKALAGLLDKDHNPPADAHVRLLTARLIRDLYGNLKTRISGSSDGQEALAGLKDAIAKAANDSDPDVKSAAKLALAAISPQAN